MSMFLASSNICSPERQPKITLSFLYRCDMGVEAQALKTKKRASVAFSCKAKTSFEITDSSYRMQQW